MKYRVIALLATSIMVILILLSGCSSSRPNAQLANLQSENTSLSLKLDNLYQEYQNLSQEHQKLQSDYDGLTAKYSSLKDENTSLTAENNKATADLNSAQQQLSDAAKQTTALQDELSALQTKYYGLQSDLQSKNDQITQLKAVSPPKNFASKDALTTWLAANTVSGYNTNDPVAVYQAAYELQQKALADGYVINVDVSHYGTTTIYFNIYCTAEIASTLYYWDVRYSNVDTIIPDTTNFKWATAP